MQLEDHVGDIIAKGRAMMSIPLSVAARAAELTENELAELERAGATHKPVNSAALGELIGLNGVRLALIAQGWLPAPQDLGRWRHLCSITTTQGGNAVNSYLVWDETSREAGLFDTGWSAPPVLDLIAQHQLRLCHVFVTHSHHDHIAALGTISERFPEITVYARSSVLPGVRPNRPGQPVTVGRLQVTHRDTPGHAEDSVTYVVDGWPGGVPPVAMVGDALFAGSMGRGFHSWTLARQNLREQILSLPPQTLICPGHGPVTTVAEEREHNPFY